MGSQKLREVSITKHLKNLKVGIKRSVKLEFNGGIRYEVQINYAA